MSEMTLTGDDLASAEMAAALAIAWWKKQPGARTKHVKGRIAELKALIAKLDAIGQHAYPYDQDCMPSDCGDDKIMVIDKAVVRETRAAARKANRHG